MDYMNDLNENEKSILDFLYRWIRPIRVGDLTGELDIKHSTLGSQLESLEKKGLINWIRYGSVSLNEEGKEIAGHLTRHHRLFEVYLVETLGLSIEEAHQESIKLTPTLSCSLIKKIEEKYNDIRICPCGNPIPGEGCV